MKLLIAGILAAIGSSLSMSHAYPCTMKNSDQDPKCSSDEYCAGTGYCGDKFESGWRCIGSYQCKSRDCANRFCKWRMIHPNKHEPDIHWISNKYDLDLNVFPFCQLSASMQAFRPHVPMPCFRTHGFEEPLPPENQHSILRILRRSAFPLPVLTPISLKPTLLQQLQIKKSKKSNKNWKAKNN